METPSGKIVHESAVIADFAINMGQKNGIPLWPDEANPGDLNASIKTAEMKLRFKDFEKDILSKMFPSFMGKWVNEEANKGLKESLPLWEEFWIKNLNGCDFLGG